MKIKEKIIQIVYHEGLWNGRGGILVLTELGNVYYKFGEDVPWKKLEELPKETK